METIPIPSKINIKDGKSEFNGIITMEPCFPGHGLTIGNAIRRNLLSTLPGAAVTAFKMKGMQHEFSSMKGVKEDLLDISLNLKQLRLRVHSDKPVRLELKAKGEKKVTAKDITPNSDVEIISKDLVIANLTDKSAVLEMEIMVSQGRGYVTAESKESEEIEVGMISIDSNFTPIKRVGFNVENVRVGQMTNWDKLVIDVETDGTITPKDAVILAVQDLLNHFTFILNNIENKAEVKEEKEEETEEKKPEKSDEPASKNSPEKPMDEKPAEKPAKRGRKPKKEKAKSE